MIYLHYASLNNKENIPFYKIPNEELFSFIENESKQNYFDKWFLFFRKDSDAFFITKNIKEIISFLQLTPTYGSNNQELIIHEYETLENLTFSMSLFKDENISSEV